MKLEEEKEETKSDDGGEVKAGGSDDELYDQYNIKREYIYITLNVLPYTFNLNEETNEYTITKYFGNEEEVIIPNSFNGLSVTSIGDSAFAGCLNIKSVEIKEGIIYVGAYAFDGCLNLNNVVISSSVTTICDYAFHFCVGLSSINIPNSVENISENAFYNCFNLTINYESPSVDEGDLEI